MGKQLPSNNDNSNNNNHEIAKKLDEFNKRLKKLEDNQKAQKIELAEHDRGLRDIKEEYPLLPPEADDLSKIVKRRGVQIMGGKKSPAYKDIPLRKRVYRDIYGEIKRNYGLIDEVGRQQSYKKLKRKYLNGAYKTVENYVAPVAIANDIEADNELEDEEN